MGRVNGRLHVVPAVRVGAPVPDAEQSPGRRFWACCHTASREPRRGIWACQWRTWMGHTLGTLISAFVAARLAASHPMWFAIGIGVLILFDGIAMILNCGGPMWFIATDLLLAYIPMALLGGRLAGGKTQTA